MSGSGSIQFARGTAAQWAASSRVLKQGEPGFDTTNRVFRIGDGTSQWEDLPSFSVGAGEGPSAATTYTPSLRGGTLPAEWTRHLLDDGNGNSPDSALTFEHGNAVFSVVGGNGATSERHEVWSIPGVPSAPYGEIVSRWASWPPTDGIVQHVHAHRIYDDGTNIRAIVLWDGIFGSPSGGVWQSSNGGTSFTSAGATVIDRETFTAASRNGSGLVTATGATAGLNTRWRVGDAIVVDAANDGYDGRFLLSAVTDTTAQWTQTNGGVDAAAGALTATLLGHEFTNFSVNTSVSYPYTGAARTNGIVLGAGVPAGHSLQKGDRVVLSGNVTDVTYNGNRVISDVNATTFQPSWIDNQADDAAAGAGNIVKNNPIWCASRVVPGPNGDLLQARFWPDIGSDINGGTGGPIPGGAPSWEKYGWTLTFDLNTVVGVTVPTDGEFGVGAAHHSSGSLVRYTDISATPYLVAAS